MKNWLLYLANETLPRTPVPSPEKAWFWFMAGGALLMALSAAVKDNLRYTKAFVLALGCGLLIVGIILLGDVLRAM